MKHNLNPATIEYELSKKGYFLRDRKSFFSCINGAYQTFDGEEIYNTPTQKAVHMFYNIVTQHPFFDGNKRVGVIICNMALYQENYPAIINVKDEQWIELVTKTAQGKYTPHQIETILNTWIENE